MSTISKIHLELQEPALVARSCPWSVFIFSKKRPLELIQGLGWGERRGSNPHYQGHILTCCHYTTFAIGRGCKNRTHSSGFGDLLATLAYPLILVVVCPPRVFSFLFHYFTCSDNAAVTLATAQSQVSKLSPQTHGSWSYAASNAATRASF